MNAFDNLGMRAKLFWFSALTGGVLLLAIAFILFEVNKISHETEIIETQALPGMGAAAKMSQLRLRYRVRSLEYLLPDPPHLAAKIEESLDSLNGELMRVIDSYGPLADTPQEVAMIDAIRSNVVGYHSVVSQARERMRVGDVEGAQQLRRTVWVERANAVRDAVDALVAYNSTDADDAARRVDSDVSAAVVGGMVAAGVGLLLTLILTLMFASRVGSRLQATVAAVGRIADGDLQSPLPSASRDEIGELVGAVSDMQKSLRQTIALTRDSANQVVVAARQLKETASVVGESTAVQSSAAAAIAANVEELTVSISHVSERTGDASRLASDSGARAREGRATVGRLIDGMTQVDNVVGDAAKKIASLESQSESISRIVAVIREIAEQTNLLALNAAIEAARAGDYGRGFAVVADEVRKLSERTGKSTEEISSMVGAVQNSTREAVAGIERGVAAVRNSSAEAAQAGEIISSLQEMAQQVSEIVAELDSALREQSMASTEVARRVEEIAEQTEETSSTTGQSAASAEALDVLAANMVQVVQRFRI